MVSAFVVWMAGLILLILLLQNMLSTDRVTSKKHKISRAFKLFLGLTLINR